MIISLLYYLQCGFTSRSGVCLVGMEYLCLLLLSLDWVSLENWKWSIFGLFFVFWTHSKYLRRLISKRIYSKLYDHDGYNQKSSSLAGWMYHQKIENWKFLIIKKNKRSKLEMRKRAELSFISFYFIFRVFFNDSKWSTTMSHEHSIMRRKKIYTNIFNDFGESIERKKKKWTNTTTTSTYLICFRMEWKWIHKNSTSTLYFLFLSGVSEASEEPSYN